MRPCRLIAAAAAILVGLIAAAPAPAQENSSVPSSRFSGLVFGDYYWVARNHEAQLENRNGWWFRRVYLTLDQDISSTWTTRTRVELSQPGDFTSSSKMQPILKDVYVEGRFGLHAVKFGLVSTPTLELYEKAWGLRSVEKAPLDLYKLATSRDIGVAAKGAFNRSRTLTYHFLVGNGSGTGTEIDRGKNAALALALSSPGNSLTFEVYGDAAGLLEGVDRRTLQAALYYTDGPVRGGVQFARQFRERASEEELKLDVASVFGTYRFRERVSAFARLDRQFQANPGAHEIAYFRFAENAETSLYIGGIDVALHEHIHVMPNVQIARYDTATPSGRRTDVMARVTVFYELRW